MNSLRCVSLLLLMLLSACDGDKAPAPPPKVAAQVPAAASPAGAADQPQVVAALKPELKIESLAVPVAMPEPTPAPAEKAVVTPISVHHLAPNVAVVPVIAVTRPDPVKPGKSALIEQKASGVSAKSANIKADNAEVANRAPVVSKSKSASQVVKETRLPKATLDLSLPPDMVKQLTPPSNVITAGSRAKSANGGGKPLLPKMFPDSNADSDFNLQGRLLSNEMQLQLRNESRKEVEGAALDFTFKQ